MGGRVLEETTTERTIELAATVLVHAVDERGAATRLEYRVERAVVREASPSASWSPPGRCSP